MSAGAVVPFAIRVTTMKFTGTTSYVATDDLMMAVNAAVTLGRPLLVKGEPGTGKTQLAEEIAGALQRQGFEADWLVIDVLPNCVSAENPSRYSESITAQGYLEERLREIKLI